MKEEIIKLVDYPYVHNAIVELHDLVDVPIPINPDFSKESPHIDLLLPGRQCSYYWDNKQESDAYFEKLFKEKIIPLYFKNKLFGQNDYVTITCEQMLNNITIAVGLVKDAPAWSQGIHQDCRTMISACVIHLQDTDRGTMFHGIEHMGKVRYTAPSKKFSGAAWANMGQSYHSVSAGLQERYAYIVNVYWKVR